MLRLLSSGVKECLLIAGLECTTTASPRGRGFEPELSSLGCGRRITSQIFAIPTEVMFLPGSSARCDDSRSAVSNSRMGKTPRLPDVVVLGEMIEAVREG